MAEPAARPAIIIFGAGLRPDGTPSPTLTRRVEAALAFGATLASPLYVPTGGVGREPASRVGREPASGVGREPASGVGREPASGAGREPASGAGREPASNIGREPASGVQREPASNVGRRSMPSEARAMAVCLRAAGVPACGIILEETARDTFDSVLACRAILRRIGHQGAVYAASSAYHLPRCLLLLRLAGLRASAVPPPPERAASSWRKRWYWRLREVPALPWDAALMLLRRR